MIRSADPKISEDWMWTIPVWSRDGIICTSEVYTQWAKLTFARGAELKDHEGLLNSSPGGNTRPAIVIHESEQVNGAALGALIRAVAPWNSSAATRR